MSETKIVECSTEGCTNTMVMSKFASPKTAKCDTCKNVASAVSGGIEGGKPVIHTASMGSDILSVYPKPMSVAIVRNRSELEAIVTLDNGEEISRIPVSVKKVTNELDYLSVSKMSTYEQCPGKFNKVYMNSTGDLVNDDNGNIFTWFGSILHEVVEIAERDYYENGVVPNVLELYDEAFKKQQLSNAKMYKEGRELILDYFKRNPVGSSTCRPIIMSDGKVCIEYEWRDRLGEVDQFGCMFDYVGIMTTNGQVIMIPYDQIPDEWFDFIIGVIKDYKSNRRPFTQQDLEDSIQLGIYEIICRMMFPKIKRWITGYELFRFGWQQCPERTQDDLDAIMGYMNCLWHQIKNDNSWKCKLNTYCGYCNERVTCKTYGDFVNDPKRVIDTIVVDTSTLEKIEEQREMIGAMSKIIDDRKKELQGIVQLAVEQATMRGEKLVIGSHEIYLQSQNRPSYDYSAARNVMALHGKINDLDKCLTINKTKLDAIAKTDPSLDTALSKCLISSYTAPYLMKKKAK